jgi:hypothetical protein
MQMEYMEPELEKWEQVSYLHPLRPLPPSRPFSSRLDTFAKAVFTSVQTAEMNTVGAHYGLSYTPNDMQKEETHREWTQTLEDGVAEDECQLANRWVKGNVVIIKDKDGEPLVGYFARVIPHDIVESTYTALLNYGNNHPAVCPTTRAKRDRKNSNDDNTTRKVDKRHRALTATDVEHAAKHAEDPFGVLHLGVWCAQGHSHENPYISRDVFGTGASSNFSRTVKLNRELRGLTEVMSAIFYAFHSYAWSHARRVGTYVWNRLPGADNIRCGDYDCWTLRAVLYNQFTHVHHDQNDEKAGYAAITRFGSFEGGEFVIPELRCKFSLHPGDVIFLRGRLLKHYVTPWNAVDKGNRKGGLISVVHTNHEALVRWAASGYNALGVGIDLQEARRNPELVLDKPVLSSKMGKS